MTRKRQSPPSSDGAGSSRPPKSPKSTSCSVGLTSDFSENATGNSRLKLEAMNQKIEELQVVVRKIEELQTEVNELKEKLNILHNPTDTDHTRSEQEDHGRYELRIIGAIKDRVYTGSKVDGQDGELLKVAIYNNGKKITSGPFSSAKFEILVVNGDFSVSDKRSWSAETFQGSLVKARKEVGSILKDNYIKQLSSGEAVLDRLIFIDNSSWATEKKWRLGIRLLESNNIRVLDAISNCFRVLDRHGKACEKPHPPLLTDGVECLEKVGKKRALDLKKKNICTVKDFLQLFHRNQSRLLEILGINSEFDESWKTMIGHAKECDAENFSENATSHSQLELEAMNRKIEELEVPFQKIEDLQTEINDLKEKLNILQNPTDTNHTRSEQVDYGQYELRIIGASDNIADENSSQVREQESSFVAQDSDVENNSTSAHEYTEDSVEVSLNDVSFQGENMEGRNEFQNIPEFPPDFEEFLQTIIVDQPILEKNIGKAGWSILKAIVLVYAIFKKKSSCRLAMLLNLEEHCSASMTETI